MMDLESAASLRVSELIPAADLPRVAVDALEMGFDSPALRILAGELDPDVGERERLFAKALEELRIETPGRPVAMMNAAKYYAARIVSGDLTAVKGARAIWWDLSWNEDAPESLRVFAGLASEYDDFQYRAQADPEARRILSDIQEQIVLEANALLVSES